MMITGNTYLIEAQIKSPYGLGQGAGFVDTAVGHCLFRSRKAYGLHGRPDGMRKKRLAFSFYGFS